MKRKARPIQVHVNCGMDNRKQEWRKFVRLCRYHKTTASEMLRGVIRSLIKEME